MVVLILVLVLVNNDFKFNGKYIKEKKLKKEFIVNVEVGFIVDNSYGNIDIVIWNENKIVIEVYIIINGNDEEWV